MKLTILQSNLREAAALASTAALKRTTLPVLQNVLIEAGADGLHLTATDLQQSLRLRVACEVHEAGAICVPAKLLADVAAKMPAGSLLIQTSPTGLLISAKGARFRLPTLVAEEFPLVPTVEAGGSVALSAEDVAQLSAMAVFCSDEETRPILNGLCVRGEAGRMIAYATNGHRAVQQSLGEAAGLPDNGVILSRTAVGMLSKAFADGCVLRWDDNRAAFEGSAATLVSSLVEGPYPWAPFASLFGIERRATLRASRRELIDAFGRIYLAAGDDETHMARCEINGRLRLTASADETGGGEEEIEVQHDGDNLTIGFNAGYVRELLNFFPAEEVSLSFSSARHNCLITGVDAAPDGPRAMLMPLQLKD